MALDQMQVKTVEAEHGSEISITDAEFQQYMKRTRESQGDDAPDAMIDIWGARYPELPGQLQWGSLQAGLRWYMFEALKKSPPLQEEHFRIKVAAIIRHSRDEYDQFDRYLMGSAAMASLSHSAVQEHIDMGYYDR